MSSNPREELPGGHRLIGRWATEGAHPLLPGAAIRGHTTFDWLAGRQFLIQRSHYDHPDIPDAVAVIGATGRPQNATSSNPAAVNQSRTCGVRSGGRWCRVQITVAPGAHSAGAAATVRRMSATLTLPKIPHSSSTSAGSASAKPSTRLASAARTST